MHRSTCKRLLLSSVPRQQQCLPRVPWQKHDLGDCHFLLDAFRIRAWQKKRQRLQVSQCSTSVCVFGSTGSGLQFKTYLPELHVPYSPRVADCTRCCSGAHCHCLQIARETCQKSITQTSIRMIIAHRRIRIRKPCCVVAVDLDEANAGKQRAVLSISAARINCPESRILPSEKLRSEFDLILIPGI